MAPSNPKRPPHGRPPSAPARPKEEIELPFDTAEVTPLRVDDPRPQRVTQYPATAKRTTTKDSVTSEILRTSSGVGLAAPFGPIVEDEFRPVYLYVERGPGAGQLVPVRQGKLTIGRSSSSDLRLQHPSISRRHAELNRQEERFFLRDLKSQNGTFINKSRLTGEKELSPGDLIAVGTAVLKLRGPLGLGELASSAPLHRSRAFKLAIFACALAFGLAGISIFALVRMRERLENRAQSAQTPLGAVKDGSPKEKPPAPSPEAAKAPMPGATTRTAPTRTPRKASPAKAPGAKAAPVRHAPPTRVVHASRRSHAAASARRKKPRPVKRRAKIRSAIDAAFGD